MDHPAPRPSDLGRPSPFAPWLAVLAIALTLRLGAAWIVTRYAERAGKPCVFGDTLIYVDLAARIDRGEAYRVEQWGVPHYALRTPGYPLFLAVCRRVFGPSLLAARAVQAVLGTLAVALVGLMARDRWWPGDDAHRRRRGLLAAALAAVEPYSVAMSALLLSEALFVPLMVGGLWLLARLVRGSARWPAFEAASAGLLAALAILARPSWALFVPAFLAGWVASARGAGRGRAIRLSAVVALATVAAMSPWWIRNARAVGRFVPTALWVGASLFDGVGPQADGSSRMEFVDAPDVRALPEAEQDDEFRRRSARAILDDPARIFRLAVVKLGRFWSPWPNADALRGPSLAVGSSLATLPTFGLIALGAWGRFRRRDAPALAVLLGPLLYFCALHLVFVSSVRYRVAGLLPALILAADGLLILASRPPTPPSTDAPPSQSPGDPRP